MATTPLPLPQFGAKVKAAHPEYADMDDAEVGRRVLAKYPEYGDMVAPDKPSLTAPIPALQKSWLQGQKDEFDQSLQTSPSDSLVRTGLKRVIGGILSPIVHPADTVKGLLAAPAESGADLVHAFRGEAPAQGPVQSRIAEAQDDYHQGGLPYAITKGAGDVGGMVLGGKVLGELAPIAGDAAATGLNAGGRLLKTGGAATSRLAVGAPAAADALGADAGAALSRNRIAGLTRRSLQRKVASTVGPASEARDAILARSEAAPVDVQPLTQAPFDDISEVKTDPQTGAVQPGAMRRLNVTRKAIQQVQDPETGRVTDTPKDLNLTPQQMGQLQTNVYDMTDYQSPESTLSNQYTKSVGARLKGAINAAAPEAETATDNIHDLLGAQEHLKATTPAPLAATDLGLGKVAGHLYDAARTGGGTAAGAAMDLTGTGMMKAGGVLRRAIASSPVAPAPQTPPVAGAPKGLPVPEAPGPGPEDLDRGGFPQRPPVTTPAPAPTLGLPSAASEGASPVAPSPANGHPGTPGPGARTRVTPSLLKPMSQQVLEDQPGFVSPRGTRPLIAGPDGTVTPQPYPLPAPPPQNLLESATGRAAPSARPALLRQFRRDAGVGAVADTMDREGDIAAGKEKLASTPEAPPEQAAVEPPIARKPLQMEKPLPDEATDPVGHYTEVVKPHLSRFISMGDGSEIPIPTDRDLTAAIRENSRVPRSDVKGVVADLLNPENEGYSVYADDDGEDEFQIGRRKGAASNTPQPSPLLPGMRNLAQTLVDNGPNAKRIKAAYPEAHTLAQKVKPGKPALVKSAPAATPSPTRLPDPTDIDGWEKLVDEGKAQYNVHTHQYEYTGPIRPKLTR